MNGLATYHDNMNTRRGSFQTLEYAPIHGLSDWGFAAHTGEWMGGFVFKSGFGWLAANATVQNRDWGENKTTTPNGTLFKPSVNFVLAGADVGVFKELNDSEQARYIVRIRDGNGNTLLMATPEAPAILSQAEIDGGNTPAQGSRVRCAFTAQAPNRILKYKF
jgi:hypothetical protein